VCVRVKEKDLSGRDTTRNEKPLHFSYDCSASQCDAVPRCCSVMQCDSVCCSVRVAVYQRRHFIVAVGANIHQSCLIFCVACYTCHKYECVKSHARMSRLSRAHRCQNPCHEASQTCLNESCRPSHVANKNSETSTCMLVHVTRTIKSYFTSKWVGLCPTFMNASCHTYA